MLREFSADECTKRGAPVGTTTCYEYEGEIYVHKERVAGSVDEVKLERVKTGGVPRFGVQDEITVVQSSFGSSQLRIDPTRATQCEKSCTSAQNNVPSKWNNGACLSPEEVSGIGSYGFISKNYEFELNKRDHYVQCPTGTMCYCWNEKMQEGKTPTEKDEFNYRMNKVRLIDYSKYRYYEERDRPGCFGQQHAWLGQYDVIINPRDSIVSAIQCGCTTQVKARLMALRNILYGFSRCLDQVKKTGTYDTGICKEIFTQYICRWAAKIISYLMEGCSPFAGKGAEITFSDNLQAFTSSIVGGAEESVTDLLADYDSPGLRDYLGVGENAIAEKVCLGALTGDWGFDIEGFMDAAYEAPFHTAVQVFPAEREYLTWNPSSEQSTYEYRVGWMISAGCDVVSYDVYLGCITDTEYTTKDGVQCRKNPSTSDKYNSATGCDCRGALAGEVKGVMPTHYLYHGGEVLQTGFEDRSVHMTVDSLYRYDHVVVRLNLADSRLRDKCFPEGHEDGVFYFPISDETVRDIAACRFDQSTGEFRCSAGRLLFNERGSAYFGEVECDDVVDCEDKTYYVGDSITMYKFEVWNLGPEKCLYWDVKNERKEIINKGVDNIPASPTEADYEKVFERGNGLKPFTILTSIDKNDLLKAPAYVYASPRGSGLQHDQANDGEIQSGEVKVKIIDSNNDGIGDKIKIGGGTTRELTRDTMFIRGAAIKFYDPQIPRTGEQCDGKPCKEFTVHIEIPTVEDVRSEQVWTLNFELRAKPENGSGFCTDSTSKDVLKSRGGDQVKTELIKVSSGSKSESYRCEYLSGYVTDANKMCDCDGTRTVVKDGADASGNLVYKDSLDCDGETKRYCYAHKDTSGKVTGHVCEENPKCYPSSKKNSVACDCNLDGNVQEDCNGKYCYEDGQCYNEAEVVKIVKIDDKKSRIGAYALSGWKTTNTIRKQDSVTIYAYYDTGTKIVDVEDAIIEIYVNDDLIKKGTSGKEISGVFEKYEGLNNLKFEIKASKKGYQEGNKLIIVNVVKETK